MKYLIFLFTIIFYNSSNAQPKLLFEAGIGIGTGWWIQESDYKIQNEIITDWANSRLSLDATISASIKYKFGKRIYIGPGFTYSNLMAQNLYPSSPYIPSFTKTKIAENSVKTVQYFLRIETMALLTKAYILTPKINVGSFQLESVHPDDNIFTDRIMLEAALQFKFNTKSDLKPFIEMYYSNLSFQSTPSTTYKRVHHIQSIGTKIGIQF